MKEIYSVEVDRYNPMALAHCLNMLADGISDFEYNWRLSANGGGIDYGVYLNVDILNKEIEICNQPDDGCGEDMIEDILDALSDDEDVLEEEE